MEWSWRDGADAGQTESMICATNATWLPLHLPHAKYVGSWFSLFVSAACSVFAYRFWACRNGATFSMLNASRSRRTPTSIPNSLYKWMERHFTMKLALGTKSVKAFAATTLSWDNFYNLTIYARLKSWKACESTRTSHCVINFAWQKFSPPNPTRATKS